jgi:uncharacterized DUF497 family protein
MPVVRIHAVVWDVNTYYATRRATTEEIEEVFANQPIIRRNLRHRTGSHIAVGRTDAGRRLTVAFIYLEEINAAVPITAWEK